MAETPTLKKPQEASTPKSAATDEQMNLSQLDQQLRQVIISTVPIESDGVIPKTLADILRPALATAKKSRGIPYAEAVAALWAVLYWQDLNG